MSTPIDTNRLWEQLTPFSDTYTCYSAALATWVACERDDWARLINPGLWLTLVPCPNRLFGFAHFPPMLRSTLGLVRTGADVGPPEAVDSLLDELRRNGRVIVTGDGFHLPWHVGFGRRHVPHWFVLVDALEGLTVLDPFACRNDLGVQEASRRVVTEDELAPMIIGLPGDDPVLALRESFALGDQAELLSGLPYQWLVKGSAGNQRVPSGARGPDAVRLLGSHFRAHGHDSGAYVQADDIWSIARHRAFLGRYMSALAAEQNDGALAGWADDHLAPLVKRWGHVAPLLMQATLALEAGRSASASVPDTLERLAEMERSAAAAFAGELIPPV